MERGNTGVKRRSLLHEVEKGAESEIVEDEAG